MFEEWNQNIEPALPSPLWITRWVLETFFTRLCGTVTPRLPAWHGQGGGPGHGGTNHT